MSTTTSTPTDPDDRIEELLDQLVPRPGPPWRRFAIGLGLTALVVAGTLSWTMGVVVPNPTATIDYGGSGQPTFVPERNAIAVRVYMPNRSKRTVRLTAVGVEAPGVRVIDVGAELEPEVAATEQSCTTEGGVTNCVSAATAVEAESLGPWPADLSPLPVTVPAGRTVWIHLLLDPTSCEGPRDLPWGEVDATVDFGPGGFPGWSHTIRIQDALAEDPQDLTLLDGEGRQAYAVDEGQPYDDLGFLAAACALVDDGD